MPQVIKYFYNKINSFIEIIKDNNNFYYSSRRNEQVNLAVTHFDINIENEKKQKLNLEDGRYFTLNTETNNKLSNPGTINSSSSMNEIIQLNNKNTKLKEKCETLENKIDELQNTYDQALEIVKNHQTFYYKIFQIFNKK